MDYDRYANMLSVPIKPVKPYISPNASPADHRKYADELEKYETLTESYIKAVHGYRAETSRRMLQFRTDALEFVGLTNHPKSDRAWDYAWEHGHDEGLPQVVHHLEDIANILI